VLVLASERLVEQLKLTGKQHVARAVPRAGHLHFG
jgi:hypothetical protein